jgi:hypothetical protein
MMAVAIRSRLRTRGGSAQDRYHQALSSITKDEAKQGLDYATENIVQEQLRFNLKHASKLMNVDRANGKRDAPF